MSLLIENAATVEAIRRLAQESGDTTEDVVARAVAAETAREEHVRDRMAAIKILQDRYASWPDSGLKADKAFFDELGGGL